MHLTRGQKFISLFIVGVLNCPLKAKNPDELSCFRSRREVEDFFALVGLYSALDRTLEPAARPVATVVVAPTEAPEPKAK